MNEAYNLLKDVAGFTEKEADEMFTVTETEKEWVIKAFRWLDGPTYAKLARATSERGGKYKKDETTKFAIFTLPKQQKEKEPSVEASIPTEVKVEEQGEYALSKSLKGKLGQLVPCLKDAQGITFDGFHREKDLPKPWTVKLDHIKTPVDRALARMTVNFCRRHYSSEEMKNDVGLLIGSGLTAEQIAEITGISEGTIYVYKPQELKDKTKVDAGKKGGEVIKELYERKAPMPEQTVKTQDTVQSSPSFARTQQEMAQQVIDCETCGKPMDRSRAAIVGGKIVCPKCAGKDKPLTPRKLEEEPAFKPKEKPDFRVAQIHPKVSKMDTAMLVRLQNNEELRKLGWRIEFQKPRTKVICISDVTLVNSKLGQEIDVYFDFTETHKNSQVEDDFARQEAARIHKIEVIPLPYDAVTETEECRLEKVILEQLKNRGSF